MNADLKKRGTRRVSDTLIFVTIIILIIFIIAITYIKFFSNFSDNKLTPMKLNYIREEKTTAIFGNGGKKDEARIYINDFALDIDYKLVDKKYSFKINNNVLKISSGDESYIFKVVQLDNHPYASVIIDELYDEYSAISRNIYKKYGTYDDENSRQEMQAFYMKHNINRTAYFETLTSEKRLKFINDLFNLKLNKLDFNGMSCNFGDCVSSAIINDSMTESKIKLYTRAKDDNEEKEYYGTFLIYEKYNTSNYLGNSVDFTSDFSMK